jgi:hypothetical protein
MAPILMEWAVPAFFFVGGYVRARDKHYPKGTTRRWLVRLLPLYVLASVLALLARRYVLGEVLTLGDGLSAFLTGSAWGIYYFVPLFAGALICSHALARWPRLVPWFCAATVAGLILIRWDPSLDPMWRTAGFHGIVRSPLFWWGYFVAGWTVKQHCVPRWPRSTIALAAAFTIPLCVVAILAGGSSILAAIARVGLSLAIPMALLFWTTLPVGAFVTLISDYSYEIYLFHFFVVALAPHVGLPFDLMAAPWLLWVLALGGGLVVGVASRKTLRRALPALAPV